MLLHSNLQALATELSGELVLNLHSGPIFHVRIDSRKIYSGEGTLFVALKGNRTDGHHYLVQAHQAGARNFILNRSQFQAKMLGQLPGSSVLLVADTLQALQQLAGRNRSLFKGPVVGITGSNGKTIIKEWLGQILSNSYNVAKSPKSYNSQIGVPLSIFGINPDHQIAVLEAGISCKGEMEKLERMIMPDIGIFSNLGTAHDENFAGKHEKLQEKIHLFLHSRYIIYNKDQPEVASLLEETLDSEKLVSWSRNPGTEYTLSVKKGEQNSKIIFIKPDMGIFTFHVPFTDEASLENLSHVIVACSTLGMLPPDIQNGLQQLRPVDMRLTVKPGKNHCTLIDDTYNNDLAGLEIALEFLEGQRPKRRKILILSDLLQAGEPAKVYQNVARLLYHYKIDLLIGIGPTILTIKTYFLQKSLFYEGTSDFLQFLDLHGFENDLILVKGARKFQFERIVNQLEERIHGTVLEINLNSLGHNFNFYKNRLKPNVKIMVMVKAFAYGGGAAEIANHLQTLGADYLSVAYTDEGVYLRQKGIKLPIMVLNPGPDTFSLLYDHRLEPVVYSNRVFRLLGNYCRDEDREIAIHLDLDTGMRRLGFDEGDMDHLKELIREFPMLKIASIYTHLAGADELIHEEYSKNQFKRFEEMTQKIKSFIFYPVLLHALNSAGIIRYPEYAYDMVRLGIGLYGIEVNDLYPQALKQAFTLKTTISQIKNLVKEDSVGYSRMGLMEKNGKIATIAIGYADGYDRRFSNGKGYVLINGQKAPVIGNVCMDMCMVDISDIEAKEGDLVLVYGEDIPLINLAKRIGTIPYELLTNISNRVKRIYYLD